MCPVGHNYRHCADESYTNTPTPSGEGEKHVTHSSGRKAERPGGAENAALFSTFFSFLLATANKCVLCPPASVPPYTAAPSHGFLSLQDGAISLTAFIGFCCYFNLTVF